MANELKNRRVAILSENGFEQSELIEPKKALEQAGATVEIVSPQAKIKGWQNKNWADEIAVDRKLDDAKADQYDALVLPGGVMNPDKLRINERAIQFIRHFVDNGKPIAAICHGPWPLIEAGGLKGRKVTSWPSLKTDLTNAGAQWVDQEVVTDHGLVTSRKPEDIPAFNRKMIEEFAEGRHTPKGKSGELTSTTR
jgi:deglycase